MSATKTEQTARQKELGHSLRSERESAGVTQADVSRAVGVSSTIVSEIELGERPLPAHRIPEHGDTAIIGAVKWLLSKLSSARYELAPAPEQVLCPLDVRTLPEVMRRHAEATMALADAQADGTLTDAEIDAVCEHAERSALAAMRLLHGARALKEKRVAERRSLLGLVKARAEARTISKAV